MPLRATVAVAAIGAAALLPAAAWTDLPASAASHVARAVGPAGTASHPAPATGRARAASHAAAGAAGPGERQAAFGAAAREFHVPLPVLLAVSYQESRWEGGKGRPTPAGGYGPMNLTWLTRRILDGHYPGSPGQASELLRAPALHTLGRAAALAGVTRARAKTSDRANIRAGAALLASYERRYLHRLPAGPGAWYAAVAAYSQAPERAAAQVFADDVYATIASGAQRTTSDGQVLRLPAQQVVPDRASIRALHLRGLTPPPRDPVKDPAQLRRPQCPARLHCSYVPAGYYYDPRRHSFGDHELARRPADVAIRYITLHDTEETADGTLWLFHDPLYQASAHYLVTAAGRVIQLVPDADIAWDSGNPAFYQHSIGIEQEGYAMHGATWYTPAMYHATATLVKYLARRYHIRLDRAHILGHDNIPGANRGNCPASPRDNCLAGQHWDPGPYWNWAAFMSLLGAPIRQDAPASGNVVTIDPSFAASRQVVTGAQPGQSLTPYPGPYHGLGYATIRPFPPQPVSFVALHTAPGASAPLLADPYLHGDPHASPPDALAPGPGTLQGRDWGDKAATGGQYVVAGRRGDWLAIWYAGRKAWFYDPAGPGRTAVPTRARLVVTPKRGLPSIPVYVDDYPLGRNYPPGFAGPAHGPAARYTIRAGQAYVAAGPAFRGDWYNAGTFGGAARYDRTDFRGSDRFYLITYNHRMAFVNAGQVSARPSRP